MLLSPNLLTALLLSIAFLYLDPTLGADYSSIQEIDNGFVVDHPYRRNSGGQTFAQSLSTRVSDWNIVCERIGDRFNEKYSYSRLGSQCTGLKTQYQLVASNSEYKESPGTRNDDIEIPVCGGTNTKTGTGFILVKLTCKLEKVKNRSSSDLRTIGFRNIY